MATAIPVSSLVGKMVEFQISGILYRGIISADRGTYVVVDAEQISTDGKSIRHPILVRSTTALEKPQ
ncbi:MAG: hypothetical protein HYT49_00805 [Candidatus Wildermuthbacteria bacterium]|nr:hypothetical protein [Candidatus Wildermuthbacteria bacterium]